MKMKHKHFPLKIEVKEDPANPSERDYRGVGLHLRGIRIPTTTSSCPAHSPKTLRHASQMLWQHDTRQPVGVCGTRPRKPPRGSTSRAVSRHRARQRRVQDGEGGVIDSMSIGYSTIDASLDMIRAPATLKKLGPMGVSLVTFPANEWRRSRWVKAAAEEWSSRPTP